MTPYSQNDGRWKNKRLGTSNETFGQVGCFVTSLSMFVNILPTETNELFIRNGVYTFGCQVGRPDKAAEVLGIKYEGKIPATVASNFTCIAETNYYAPVVKKHFFVRLANGRIIDPIDGREQPNKYHKHIVSYRLFKEKENNQGANMTKQEVIDQFDRFIAGKTTDADIAFWMPRDYAEIATQLTKQTEGANPSERFDLINAICKKMIGRDATVEEQNIFETQRWSISAIVKWALQK